MRLRTLVKPTTMLGTVLLFQAIVGLLFLCGAIPSFTLNPDSIDMPGFTIYLLLFAGFLVIMLAFTRDSRRSLVDSGSSTDLPEINFRRLNLVIDVLLFATLVGVILIISITISGYGILDYLMACIENDIRTNEELEAGPFHMFLVFPLVCSPLLALGVGTIPRSKLKLVLMVLFSGYLGAVFGSRLILFETVIAMVVAIVRTRYYKTEFTLNSFLGMAVLLSALLLIFVYVSGNRDFKHDGYRYTDSTWAWGISRTFDYPLSTVIYASHSLELITPYSSIQDIIPTISRISPSVHRELLLEHLNNFRGLYGQTYYTNMSGIGQLFYSCGALSPVIIIGYSALIVLFYRKYDLGKIEGILLYPHLLYSIFETWRTCYILTENVQVTLVLLLIIGHFILGGRDKRNAVGRIGASNA